MFAYVVGIFGGNYAQPDQTELRDWVLVSSLDNAREFLADCVSSSIQYPMRGGWIQADGDYVRYSTPNYGDPGDGAYLYRIGAGDQSITSEIGELIEWDYPAYLAEFGPRGGIQFTRG